MDLVHSGDRQLEGDLTHLQILSDGLHFGMHLLNFFGRLLLRRLEYDPARPVIDRQMLRPHVGEWLGFPARFLLKQGLQRLKVEGCRGRVSCGPHCRLRRLAWPAQQFMLLRSAMRRHIVTILRRG